MGELAALLAAFTWSGTSVALTSLSARVAPAVLSGLRLTTASLLLPFLLLLSGQASDLSAAPASAIVAMVGSGFIGYALGDTLYIRSLGILGMQRTFPISSALFIALTVAGGVLLLDEPFKLTFLAGALLIGAGVFLIVVPARGARSDDLVLAAPAEPALAGMVATRAGRWSRRTGWLDRRAASGYLALLAVGVLWASASLWLAVGREDLGAVAAASIRTPAGAVGLLVFTSMVQPVALRAPFRDRRAIVLIAAAGVIGTGFGSLMFVYAVGEAGAARTAVLNAASPLMALPLTVFFLKEPLTRRVLLGTVVCVLGIVLVVV